MNEVLVYVNMMSYDVIARVTDCCCAAAVRTRWAQGILYKYSKITAAVNSQ